MREITSEQTCEDIIQLLNEMKLQMISLAEAKGLTRVQLFALYSIEQRGTLAMGQVAEALHCDASNVTGIVDRLVAQELVMRQALPQDRRTKTLILTEKGRKTVNALKNALPDALKCDTLSDEEREVLHRIVRKITVGQGG